MVVSIDVTHIYKYPVEFVAKTHMSKVMSLFDSEYPSVFLFQYPSEKEKFVERIDTIEHKKDISTGLHYWKRIAVCANVVPKLLRTIHVLNEKAILLEEQAWLDSYQRTFKLKSRNLTWCSYANMHEESYFRPSKDNSKWTIFEQHGVIDIKGLGPFGRVIEVFAKQFLHAGVKRSLNIMEDLLTKRYSGKNMEQS